MRRLLPLLLLLSACSVANRIENAKLKIEKPEALPAFQFSIFNFQFRKTGVTNLHQDAPAVNAVIDDWHKAASVADESRYFGHMSPDAVFLGTDASERWDYESFRTFAHPYFAKGKAWTFVPRERHVNSSGDIAWFDEKLDSATYGECRGSGVLRRLGGQWKIAQYNLTIPIPNALANKVVAIIRGE